jgi:endonuclease I
VVEFNLQAGLDGAPLVPVVFPLDPQSFFATDAGLDFSVVAVKDDGDQPVRLEEFRWLPLDGSQGKVIVGEFVNIIQHPDGEPKQLALRENQVVDLLDRFVHYLTDTARGSSGSPVCNDQWEVVALHHSAVPKTDREGRPLTLDNALWQPWMGEHKLAWKANEGVRVSRILQALSRATLTGTPARLRDELLHPPGGPPPPSATAQVATGATAGTAPAVAAEPHRYTPRAGVVPGVGGVSAVTAGRSGPGAGVEITVPLHITVGVGAPSSRWPADGLSTAGGPGAGMVAGDAAGAAATPTPAVDGQGYGHPDATAAAATAAATAATAAARDLNAALLNLRLARDRVYYDERSDLAARDVYYAGLDPDTDGDRLREALTRLLESTHERRPSYSPSRLLYPWIELHPDRLLRSIYSGKTFTPEELIHADAAAEAARLTRLQEFLSRETTAGPAELTAELDALEAALPFNCEHVVPQSWFGKREPMRGDLHHLFACEPDCNSYRGNIRYHDFADYHETVRPGCGKREKEGFEPAHGKGAAARATLYFLLRYPGLVGDEDEELTPDRIPTLLAWHQEEPPTLYEHHRNTAIADVQGNRNPLVDHPDWAEHIDFAP